MLQQGHLEWIKIAGFKSIKEAKIELRPLNLLIGANGAGKTNFIEVFHLLNEILKQRLQIYSGSSGADSLLHFGSKITDTIKIETAFYSKKSSHRNGYRIRLIPTEDNQLFLSEEIWFHNPAHEEPYDTRIGYGGRETHLFDTDQRMAKYIINALQNWIIYHFHDTSRSAKVKSRANIHDNERLRPDASNLAPFLYLLKEKHPQHYRKIVRMIRRVAPFFRDFNLHPLRLNPEEIELEWREQGSDMYFNAHTLSDGTLRFICLATLLLQPELPSVILIDEPELGLHPYALYVLADLLRSAAQQTQVIVSTQSVPLVNQFSPEDIIVVDRVEGASQFERKQTTELDIWLDEYGMGDLWEKNLIGGKPQR